MSILKFEQYSFIGTQFEYQFVLQQLHKYSNLNTYYSLVHNNVTGFAETRHNSARTEIHFIA